jgi:hypothetical protein
MATSAPAIVTCMNFLPLAGILFAGCGLIGESIEVWPDVPAPDFNPVAPMMDSPTIALLQDMIPKSRKLLG